MAVRATLVAVVAAVAFGGMAAGTPQVALADPPAAGSDSGSSKQNRLAKIKAKIYELAAPLDPADPDFKKKLVKQIAANRVITKLSNGSVGISASDLQGLVSDAFEYVRRSKQTVSGLQTRMEKMDEYVQKLRDKVAKAKTTEKRKEAIKELQSAKKDFEALKKLYKDAKRQTEPLNWDKEVKRLDNRVKELEKRVNGKHRSDTAKKKVQTSLDQARADLDQAKADRDRYRRPDGGEGGTPAKKKDPKQPPKNPSTGAKKTTSMPPSTGSKKTTSTKLNLGGVKKPGTTAFGPRTRIPRGGRGSGAEVAGALVGDVLTEVYAEHIVSESEKWYQKALKDPALRKQIIDDYKRGKKSNLFGDVKRAFDDTKKFTSSASTLIGQRLIDYQKGLDDKVKKAQQSAKDPLYKQAMRECGSYDTCVKERVKKLRAQNAKDIAKSKKKAEQSAKDPLYKQAMRECGGYDTCVQDRLKKLRAQKPDAEKKPTTKKTTEPKNTDAKKKSDASTAKKQYEEAAKICGGYETCVKDRLKKVRATDAKPKKEISKPKKETKKTKK
jgi:hypothetical protein